MSQIRTTRDHWGQPVTGNQDESSEEVHSLGSTVSCVWLWSCPWDEWSACSVRAVSTPDGHRRELGTWREGPAGSEYDAPLCDRKSRPLVTCVMKRQNWFITGGVVGSGGIILKTKPVKHSHSYRSSNTVDRPVWLLQWRHQLSRKDQLKHVLNRSL